MRCGPTACKYGRRPGPRQPALRPDAVFYIWQQQRRGHARGRIQAACEITRANSAIDFSL